MYYFIPLLRTRYTDGLKYLASVADCYWLITDASVIVMIYLNFTDLSEETQERLLADSKEDVKRKYGKDLMDYATKHHTNLDRMLDEEAIRNLYSYTFVFNI